MQRGPGGWIGGEGAHIHTLIVAIMVPVGAIKGVQCLFIMGRMACKRS